MKYDLYELFSEYEGELPEIEESSRDTKRIKRLALQGIEKKKHRIRTKVFVIGIAATYRPRNLSFPLSP